MALSTWKRKYNLRDREECTRRESDKSGDEMSDEESEMSSVDSEAEAMALEGGDIIIK